MLFTKIKHMKWSLMKTTSIIFHEQEAIYDSSVEIVYLKHHNILAINLHIHSSSFQNAKSSKPFQFYSHTDHSITTWLMDNFRYVDESMVSSWFTADALVSLNRTIKNLLLCINIAFSHCSPLQLQFYDTSHSSFS